LSADRISAYSIISGALIVLFLNNVVAKDLVERDQEAAEKFFLTGVSLLKKGDLPGATAEFEQSVSLYPTASALFNLANCYKASRRYQEAMHFLARTKKEYSSELKLEILEAIRHHEAEIKAALQCST